MHYSLYRLKAEEWSYIMNTLKVILFGMICTAMLTACSANENHKNTTSTDTPSTEAVTEKATEKADDNSVRDDAGNIIDDAGNVVEDAGDAVDDAANDVGNAVSE